MPGPSTAPSFRGTVALISDVLAFALGLTGTLGGHLVGMCTEVSDVLRWLGREVFATFCVPHAALAAIGLITLLLVGLGLWGRRAGASGDDGFVR